MKLNSSSGKEVADFRQSLAWSRGSLDMLKLRGAGDGEADGVGAVEAELLSQLVEAPELGRGEAEIDVLDNHGHTITVT